MHVLCPSTFQKHPSKIKVILGVFRSPQPLNHGAGPDLVIGVDKRSIALAYVPGKSCNR